MNKIIDKEIIREVIQDFIDTSYQEHRRGSNFYTKSIVEINEEYFPELDRDLDGFWETNIYIWDENDWDRDEITELNRVEKAEKVITENYWKLIE